VVSSFDETTDWAPPPVALAASDGDMLTRWSSKLGLDNQWIYFDLGAPKAVSKIIIHWEAAYATEYKIFVSCDAKEWQEAASLKGQDGKIDKVEFPAVKAQFVKMEGIKRFNEKDFFEAHEILEDLWHEYRESDRTYLQALIQVSAGLYHADAGNLRGARSQLSKALQKLTAYPVMYKGVDVESLVRDVGTCLTTIGDLERRDSPAPSSSFFPQIKITSDQS